MQSIPRRTFLTLLGAAVSAAAARRSRSRAAPRYPLAFSTLGCPAWSWKTVLDVAAREGYAAIELRGLEGTMDLPSRAEFAGGRIDATRADLDALDLTIVSVDSSVALHVPPGDERTKALDEGKRYIDLARQLRAPYVRVFGDKVLPGVSRDETIARIVDGLRALGTFARGSEVTILVESHGDFTDSRSLRAIMDGGVEGVALLWDAHHTVVSAKETPAETFAALGPFVRHTHLKDSTPTTDGYRYVLTGTGAVPVRETVHVLARAGYTGFYCFEWEKAWHPELEDPGIALPHYARVMREWLDAAGVRPR